MTQHEGQMADTLVIYHGGGCFDGFCAAWVLRKVVPAAEFVAAKYGEPPPDCTGKRVVIADFSYKRPVMRQILSQAAAVTVLDHHKTAEAELAGICDEFCMRPDLIRNPPGSELPRVVFDMTKSGGRLAWEHVCGGGLSSFANLPVPWLVEYTEDRDLWRWTLPDSKAVNAALRTYPMTFAEWDRLAVIDPAALVPEGEAVLRAERVVVEQHVRNAREIELAGHRIKAVNATTLFSEIAGELAETGPFGACYFDRGDGKRQWSLRSRWDGVDVSEIAKQFGGGGHRNAAGFEQFIRGV